MIYLAPIKFKLPIQIYYNTNLFFFNKKNPAKVIYILKSIIKSNKSADIFIAPDLNYNNKFYIPFAKALAKYSVPFKILYFAIDKSFIAIEKHGGSNIISIVPAKKSKITPIISNKSYCFESVNKILLTYYQNIAFLDTLALKSFDFSHFK